MIGETADDVVVTFLEDVAHAGNAQDGIDGDERVGRREHDARRRVKRRHDLRGRRRRLGADDVDRRHRDAVVVSNEVLLKAEATEFGVEARRDRVIGYRQQSHGHAESIAELARDLCLRGALAEAL